MLNNNENKRVYTVKEVQQILCIGKNTVYDLIKSDAFPVIQIKSTYRIPKQAFDNWLNQAS